MFACREVMELSDAFIDGELCWDSESRILLHLRLCSGCPPLIRAKQDLKRLIRVKVRSVKAPAGLGWQVRANIGLQHYDET
jgi:hypothetical protein